MEIAYSTRRYQLILLHFSYCRRIAKSNRISNKWAWRQVAHGDSCISDLNLEIRQLVHHHKWAKSVEYLKSCNLPSRVSKPWVFLSNTNVHDNHVEIQFNLIVISPRTRRNGRTISLQLILHPLVEKIKEHVIRRLSKLSKCIIVYCFVSSAKRFNILSQTQQPPNIN